MLSVTCAIRSFTLVIEDVAKHFEDTHLSPWLKTKGCDPSAGHRALSLNAEVSQITSNIS